MSVYRNGEARWPGRARLLTRATQSRAAAWLGRRPPAIAGESDVSRFKRVIGVGLRSRTNRRRATEIAIAVSVLNRMLELGLPEYVRLP